MDSEEALAAHIHEIQALTAYPDRIDDFVNEGLLESILGVLMHPNIDICSLCVTLLYELCDLELAKSHADTVKKILGRYADNKIWTLLQKVSQNAREEKQRKGLQDVSERTDEDILEQKCLNLLQNMLEIQGEVIAPKIMHADAFIDYLLTSIEVNSSSTSIMSYTQVLCSELITQTVQNCGQGFRSKFVITLHGIVRLLTIIDSQLEQDQIVDTTLDVMQNLMDTIAILLVDDQIKENAGIFQEARGYQMML